MASTSQDNKQPEQRFAGMVVYFVETGVQPRRLQDGLSYQWLEDCLKEGSKLPEEKYCLEVTFEDMSKISPDAGTNLSEENGRNLSDDHNSRGTKRTKVFSDHSDVMSSKHRKKVESNMPVDGDVMMDNTSVENLTTRECKSDESGFQKEDSDGGSDSGYGGSDQSKSDALASSSGNNAVDKELTLLYNPPNLNQNITEPFAKLCSIYKDALGDDRRSFSYHKALSVLEKIPFKIVSVDQVKGLPAIGKSMQDHIHEIIQTGRLGKLEHFEKDEKVVVVCGGSYRRGKAFCGDMDIIITHPDGRSHKGFLPKFVKHLKEVDFLKEDLLFSIHSIEGTDSGVDTYFGICKYPGRQQHHRIDFKVVERICKLHHNILSFSSVEEMLTSF